VRVALPSAPAQGSVHGLTVRVRRSDFGDTAFRATQKDATKYTAQCLALPCEQVFAWHAAQGRAFCLLVQTMLLICLC